MTKLLATLWRWLHLPTNVQLFIMRRFNDQFLIGVTGIIFNERDEILLFKHTYRGGDTWSLPGGYLKSKEHPREGLEREIKEESGLVVSVDEQLQTGTDRDAARIEIAYVGTFIGGEFTPSAEVSQSGFFDFHDLPRLPKDQLIFIDKVIRQRRD